jgi:hypothetical protein
MMNLIIHETPKRRYSLNGYLNILTAMTTIENGESGTQNINGELNLAVRITKKSGNKERRFLMQSTTYTRIILFSYYWSGAFSI